MLVRAGRDLLSARPPLDLPRLTHPHPHPLLDHADDTTTVARRSARANSSASSNGRAAAGARADPSAGHLDADDDQLSSATAHHLDARTETDWWVEVAPANGEAEYWLHSLTGEKVHEPPMEWILAQEAKIDAATATNATRTPRARSTDAEPSRQGVVAAAQKKMKYSAGVGAANAFALLGDDDGDDDDASVVDDDDDGDGDAPATRARPAPRAPPATKVPAAKPDPVAAMDAEWLNEDDSGASEEDADAQPGGPKKQSGRKKGKSGAKKKAKKKAKKRAAVRDENERLRDENERLRAEYEATGTGGAEGNALPMSGVVELSTGLRVSVSPTFQSVLEAIPHDRKKVLVEALEVSYQIKEMSIKEMKQVITREGGSLVGVTERFDLMEKYITAVIRSLAREIPSIRPLVKVQLEDKGFPSEFEDEPQQYPTPAARDEDDDVPDLVSPGWSDGSSVGSDVPDLLTSEDEDDGSSANKRSRSGEVKKHAQPTAPKTKAEETKKPPSGSGMKNGFFGGAAAAASKPKPTTKDATAPKRPAKPRHGYDSDGSISDDGSAAPSLVSTGGISHGSGSDDDDDDDDDEDDADEDAGSGKPVSTEQARALFEAVGGDVRALEDGESDDDVPDLQSSGSESESYSESESSSASGSDQPPSLVSGSTGSEDSNPSSDSSSDDVEETLETPGARRARAARAPAGRTRVPPRGRGPPRGSRPFDPFRKRKRGKITEKALFKIMQSQSERNTAWVWSSHGLGNPGQDAGVKELVVQVLKVGTNLDGKTSLSLSDGFCWHECELGGIGAGIGALNPCKVEDIHEGCLLSLNGVMFTGTLSDAVIVQPGCVCCTAAELEERASSAADVYQKMRDVNGNDIKLFNEYDLPNEDRKVTKLLRGDNTGTGARAARAGRTAPAASAGAGANAAGRGKLSKEEREADEVRRKLQEEEEKAAREQRKREREEEKKRKEAEKAEKESARRAAQRAKKKSTEPGAGGRAGAPGGPGDAAPSIEVVEETRTPEELDEISFANLQAIVTGFKDRGVVAETNEVKRRIREKRRERHAAAEARHRERAEAEAKAAEEAAAAAALAAVEEAEEDAAEAAAAATALARAQPRRDAIVKPLIPNTIEELKDSLEDCQWECDISREAMQQYEELARSSLADRNRVYGKLFELASGKGHHHASNDKNTNVINSKFNLFKTRFSNEGRIVWERAVSFSQKLKRHTDIIRIWAILTDHDKVNKAIEEVEKSHVKARESLRGKKKVRLVKIAEGKSEDGVILSLPREEEERAEHAAAAAAAVDEIEVIPPVVPGEDSFVLLNFYEMNHGLVNAMMKKPTSLESGEYWFRMSEEEIALSERYWDLNAQHQKSVLLIGRSGTGKTTVMLRRLYAEYEKYWLTFRLGEAQFTSAGGAKTDRNQLFITANPVLRNEIRRYFAGLTAGFGEQTNGAAVLPYKCPHVGHSGLPGDALTTGNDEGSFPLFLTKREWLIALDGVVDEPFFERDNDGNLTRDAASHAWAGEKSELREEIESDDGDIDGDDLSDEDEWYAGEDDVRYRRRRPARGARMDDRGGRRGLPPARGRRRRGGRRRGRPRDRREAPRPRDRLRGVRERGVAHAEREGCDVKGGDGRAPRPDARAVARVGGDHVVHQRLRGGAAIGGRRVPTLLGRVQRDRPEDVAQLPRGSTGHLRALEAVRRRGERDARVRRVRRRRARVQTRRRGRDARARHPGALRVRRRGPGLHVRGALAAFEDGGGPELAVPHRRHRADDRARALVSVRGDHDDFPQARGGELRRRARRRAVGDQKTRVRQRSRRRGQARDELQDAQRHLGRRELVRVHLVQVFPAQHRQASSGPRHLPRPAAVAPRRDDVRGPPDAPRRDDAQRRGDRVRGAAVRHRPRQGGAAQARAPAARDRPRVHGVRDQRLGVGRHAVQLFQGLPRAERVADAVRLLRQLRRPGGPTV